MFKRLLKVIVLAYIYQLTKFCGFMISSWCHWFGKSWMVKNAKAWISWERNIIFLQNKKILNLCFRWQILRSYHFEAEVTFKILIENRKSFLSLSKTKKTKKQQTTEAFFKQKIEFPEIFVNNYNLSETEKLTVIKYWSRMPTYFNRKYSQRTRKLSQIYKFVTNKSVSFILLQFYLFLQN